MRTLTSHGSQKTSDVSRPVIPRCLVLEMSLRVKAKAVMDLEAKQQQQQRKKRRKFFFFFFLTQDVSFAVMS